MVILTAYVIGPTDDTDGVKAAGAACLVPVHPAVGHAVPRIERRGEAEDAEVGVREVLEKLDGRGDREAREEGGEEGHDDGVDGRHRDVCGVWYQVRCILVYCRMGCC